MTVLKKPTASLHCPAPGRKAIPFERNEKLEEIVDAAVAEIVKNQDEFGYFNSHFLVTEQDQRFQNRDRHELYCAGHLMEAAAAYYESTGKDALLKAMCKYADYIERIFKIEDSAAFTTPGHPELELALMTLYKATGEKRYADLSKYFIDKHGNNDKDQPIADWATINYSMDEVPLREATEPRGHAVRACYLLCGMADVALEYGDQELFEACERCYESLVNKRMYITGGIGSTRHGEAFTIDYHMQSPWQCSACACRSTRTMQSMQTPWSVQSSTAYFPASPSPARISSMRILWRSTLSLTM